MATEDIKEALTKNPIIGTDRILKNLKSGKLKKVFLASNCKEETKKDVGYYAKLSNVEVVNLDIPNDELGLACKKQFSISILGY
ncbi:MAG TPA: ribosomal L7Ae/L30e/S12e/Gadd45 family protein [Candidatus Nanoarchaeia archaeon]|nr:ribosomal L7Ae/L30e/S12e/Gadd45 family protein [Candidatus Nanoarchaeia archaeon]